MTDCYHSFIRVGAALASFMLRSYNHDRCSLSFASEVDAKKFSHDNGHLHVSKLALHKLKELGLHLYHMLVTPELADYNLCGDLKRICRKYSILMTNWNHLDNYLAYRPPKSRARRMKLCRDAGSTGLTVTECTIDDFSHYFLSARMSV